MFLVTYNIVQEGDFTFGNTLLESVGTGLYRTNGNLTVDFSNSRYDKDDDYIQGTSFESFYPINNNTEYTQNRVFTYLETNSGKLNKPFLSTQFAELETVEYRAIEEKLFFTSGVADYHIENVCPKNLQMYSAMQLGEPNYQSVNFSDVFVKNAGNNLVLLGDNSLNLPYYPFHTVFNQISMTKNFVSFFDTNISSKRLNPEDVITSITGDPLTVAPNFSLYRAASQKGQGYRNIFSTYSIKTPLSLKESDNSYEYHLRKSGFIGQVVVTIIDIITDTSIGQATNYYPHTLFEVAPLSSNDTLQLIRAINFKTTSITLNPFPSFRINDAQFFINRETYCGADFFFQEESNKNVTIQASGFLNYTFYANGILREKQINGVSSSFLIGNKDYLALENRCVGKRDETYTFVDAEVFGNYQPAKNVFFTMPCYPREDLAIFAAENNGGNPRDYLKYANYLDFDHILLAAAKTINTIYPVENFGRTDAGSIHNQFTTYWNNNII